jgi:predicted SAM-dependent methyltransferase
MVLTEIEMIKLHLGCGPRNFGDDWVHIDGGDYDHLDSYDIINLPVDDNSVDLIYASHVLEYFDREEAGDILGKWFKALKAGGVLRLAVPDFHAMVRLYFEQNLPLETFLGPLYGKMKMGGETIYHKTTYDQESLVKLLEEKVGFSETSLYNWDKTCHGDKDDHSQAYIPHMDKENGALISLNVECKKSC